MTDGPLEYATFLADKIQMAPAGGFEVSIEEINPILLPHHKAIIVWACAGGRRAIFAAFGLGKTVIQIELLRIVIARFGGRGLIVLPLGVRQEFRRDCHMLATGEHEKITDQQRAELRQWQAGRPERIPSVTFIRSIEQAGETGLYLANYETIRDGKLDPKHFIAASLDEASCLRGFGGSKTFREFMRLFEGVRFKFVATATPSPNEFIELLAYSAFLEVMDVGQAKTRFFKRNSEKADTLTIHPHKEKEFWLWVASWGLFVNKPSDLCGCSCHVGRNSRVNASAGSKSSSGSQGPSGTAHGFAAATAEASTSHHRAICLPDVSAVAAVSGHGTDVSKHPPIAHGDACTTVSTGIGETIEAEASASVLGGVRSFPSSTTWDNHRADTLSSEKTTIEAMSPEIADGPAERNRRGILAAPSESFTTGSLSPSLLGPKNSVSATGSSIHDTNPVGPSTGCSETLCARCRALDEGYDLPSLEIHWHELPADHGSAGTEKSGQVRLLRNAAASLSDAAREKRDSLPARIAKMMELRAEDPDAHRLIWHDLEAERHAIEAAIPGVRTVYGSQDLDEREQSIIDFSEGRFAELAGKASIMGSGCNFQRHCSWAIFLGIGFKFNDFIQAVHRIQRFLQKHTVRLDLIYTEAERPVRDSLEAKWRRHEQQRATMTGIIKEYGLSAAAMAQTLQRAMGVERIEVTGDGYRLVNNDCVMECQSMPADSVDLIVTSIPFSTQYEYSPNYADFGHTDDNEHFWQQMDYLIPQLYRVLAPGRVAVIHVKDRIVPGGMTGLGFQTVYPFADDCTAAFRKHGFAFISRKPITTDVVRENNQTYRLGWSEQCKDGSRMGDGLPEYLLIFRKPPTDRSNGYADKPVKKAKKEWVGTGPNAGWTNPDGYSRARWQLDAHAYMPSSGNRQLRPEELMGLEAHQIFKLWKAYSLNAIYDFEHHVKIAEALEERGMLPSTFMLLPPHSKHEDVWTDVTRMLSMNTLQAQAGREMHLCPLQFDIVDRCIARYSEEGETVFDPFGGLMTVPYRAIKLRRRGAAVELNPAYFLDGCKYVEAAAREMTMPSLFDLMEAAE